MDDFWFLKLNRDEPLPRAFSSEDYAILLGLKAGLNGESIDDHITEDNRMMILLEALSTTCRQSDSEVAIMWSRFLASYLPCLVERILNPPALKPDDTEMVATRPEDYLVRNAFTETLMTTMYQPYSTKFFLSTKPAAAHAKSLLLVWASRLLERAPSWDREFLTFPPGQTSGNFIEIAERFYFGLLFLCVMLLRSPDYERLVPWEVKSGLKKWLTLWADRYSANVDDEFGSTCHGLLTLLLPHDSSTMASLRRYISNRVTKILKNSAFCGLPSCNSRKNLNACGRCLTVRYCCVQHQALHWKYTEGIPHKRICFATEY